jgi:hypothetical protein
MTRWIVTFNVRSLGFSGTASYPVNAPDAEAALRQARKLASVDHIPTYDATASIVPDYGTDEEDE